MAYNTRFRFRFEGLVSHRDIEILVKEDGYTGQPVNRAVGGAPVLRRDSSGTICGTSLEWPAECLIDEEYSILYTSDPMQFRVELTINGALAWQGFISTEMYADPDIAPPYDVILTATDGLGELKNSVWSGMPGYGQPGTHYNSVHGILTDLLSYTGQAMPIYYANELKLKSGVFFFQNAGTDIGNMMGETCYDVLTALLESCNATLTSCGPCWVLLREADAEWIMRREEEDSYYRTMWLIGSGVEDIDDSGLPGLLCGSMQFPDCPNWTLGQMSREIVPARHSTMLKTESAYRDSALAFCPFGRSSGYGWGTGGGAMWQDGRFYIPRNGYVHQTYTAAGGHLRIPLTLTLDFANNSMFEVSLDITVSVLDNDDNWHYLVAGPDSFKSKSRKRRRLQIAMYDYVWTDTPSSIQVATVNLGDGTSEYAQQLLIDIPISSGESNLDLAGINIQIKNVSQSSSVARDVYLVGASLNIPGERSGFEYRVNIDNGSRGEGPEHASILFSNVDDTVGRTGVYTTPEALDFMYGSIVNQQGVAQKEVYTHRGLFEWGEFMVRDYALSIATPRLRRSGRVNAAYLTLLPVHARLRQGGEYTPFLLESFEWDLLNEEMEVSMISLPTNEFLEVESETLIEAEEQEEQQSGTPANAGSSPTPTPGGDITASDVINALGYTPVRPSEVPSRVGQLDNDAGYMNQKEADDWYQPKGMVPTLVGQLTNDVGYISKTEADDYYQPKGPGGDSNLFIAEFDDTSFAEVISHIRQGHDVVVRDQSDTAGAYSYWHLVHGGNEADSIIYFSRVDENGQIELCKVDSDDSWSFQQVPSGAEPKIALSAYLTCSGSSITIASQMSQTGMTIKGASRSNTGRYTLNLSASAANKCITITPVISSYCVAQLTAAPGTSLSLTFRSASSTYATPIGFSILIMETS